ncbi:hypothetical protein B5F76_11440 [Desulfovibrio sp. An276]|uniref:hypothetical protein n=1 Tax=Desulfovibrio sp. An276 TaxID=1965618 RepID=UPI000B39BFD8|nr:hypothetical protein [Desulfovibrio sp. An276]OUO50554.1 hypothetical protein B5F76_11440 [Desulfovibrio sp. An276]
MDHKSIKKEKLFCIEDDFFLIDSNNTDHINEQIYGFAITEHGIIDRSNLNHENAKYIDGCGTYIHISISNNEIIIRQDNIGSYGIYLYTKDNYYALSNSFFLLVSHLINSAEISFNRDYANHLILSSLCSVSYRETMVNEISVLDRNAIIHINRKNKLMSIEYPQLENPINSLDQYEAINLLDKWYNKWRFLIKNIYKINQNLVISLSGGIDSRISFLLALKSGINLNNTMVYSIHDKLHTHIEDFNIAKNISKVFNFDLNNEYCLDKDIAYYKINDLFNICLYGKIFFHKQLYIKDIWYNKKRFYLSGSGGEILREYWNITPQQLIKKLSLKAKFYSKDTSLELKKSLYRILQDTYKNISQKLGILPDSCQISKNTYLETRCRNHFGKAAVETFFSNTYTLSPLLDPILFKIPKTTPNCRDENLLIALIFTRYCPELLNFPFEGGRKLNYNTIQYAQKLVKKFPFHDKNNFVNNDFLFPKTNTTYANNFIKENNIKLDSQIQIIFNSKKFSNYIHMIYNNDVYYIAKEYSKTIKFYPNQEIIPLIAISILNILIHISKIKTDSLTIFDSVDHYVPHHNLLSPIRAKFFIILFSLMKKNEKNLFVKLLLNLIRSTA